MQANYIFTDSDWPLWKQILYRLFGHPRPRLSLKAQIERAGWYD
jgi:hypothetical protein